MINLLQQKNKEGLLQEENLKVIIILGINVFTILVCFALVLYSINIFVSGEILSQKIIYEQKEKELEAPGTMSLEKNLISFNQTFSRLDHFYQSQFKTAKILEEISETVPKEIYLTNLSISQRNGKEEATESILAGFSPNREALLEFKENLEKKENFSEIYFPPGSWVKPADINFTVNFKIVTTEEK